MQHLKHGPRRSCRSGGYSVVEVLIVVAIIFTMSAIAVPYLFRHRIIYKSEEQALRIMDLMREASQMALNQRRTIRLEIDTVDSAILIIDGNGAATDTLVKRIPIESSSILRMDVSPFGIGRPNPPNYPPAVFGVDSIGHMSGSTAISGNTVWALKFRSDGSVVNAGNVPISATLFVFPPGTGSTTSDPNQVRAITLSGGSGAVRFWSYNGTTFSAR